MQRFAGKIAAAIHNSSDQKVTMGSASIMWNSYSYNASANYWDDQALISAAEDSLAYLDFYQIHYYDWMFGLGCNPFYTNPIFWKLDKPAIIGEFPAKDGEYDVGSMLRLGLSNGWAGVLSWSYWGGDGAGKWINCKNEHLAMRNLYPDIIDVIPCDSSYAPTELILENFTIYPNPVSSLMRISVDSTFGANLHYYIYNLNGSLLKKEVVKPEAGVVFLDLTSLPKGIFLLKIKNSNVITITKFLKN